MAEGQQKVSAPSGIEPEQPDSLQLTLITKPWVRVSLQENILYNLTCLATGNRFFECRTVVLRLLRLNIKARHENPEFLNANL